MGDPVCLYTKYPHSLCTQLKVSLLYPLITSLYIRYTLFYIEGSMLLKLLRYTIVVKWTRKLSIIGPKNCPPPNGKNSILLYDLTILSLGRVNFSKTLLFQSIFVKNYPLSYKKLWLMQGSHYLGEHSAVIFCKSLSRRLYSSTRMFTYARCTAHLRAATVFLHQS